MSTKCFLSLSHLAQLSQLHSAKTGAAAPAAALKPARRGLSGARVALALALAAGLPTAAGCGSSDLTPNVVLVDHTIAPLSLGALNAINGTYGAGCIGRTGSWSSAIGAYSGGLENAQLSVVKANSACVLTLTSVLIGSTKYDPASTVNLSGSYSNTAVAYTAEGETAIAFYGNLKLSDATYSSSFSISLLFSDDPTAASAGSPQADYKYNSIGSTQSNVVPTDYTVDGSSVGVLTDADKVISDVSGSIDLTDGTVTGQNYVISSASLGSSPSFDTIDTAYLAGTPVTISGSNPSIAASALGLVGTSLATVSAKREVIVAHIVSNTRAYQVITLTVVAP
jgi:hypothetical protein